MRRRPVRSTTLASVGHEPGSGVLELEFTNGMVYQYTGVPESVVRELLEAPSRGQYFNFNIRDHYQYRRVK
jgi:hypothetical protein